MMRAALLLWRFSGALAVPWCSTGSTSRSESTSQRATGVQCFLHQTLTKGAVRQFWTLLQKLVTCKSTVDARPSADTIFAGLMELLSNRKGVFFPNASLLAALAQQPEVALCSRDQALMPSV